MPNRAIRGATPLIVILLSGCATTPFDPATTFTRQVSMAWSLQSLQDEMVVKISPARQTLRFAGTTGLVIGAGIDAVANSKHREAIREALGDYDAEGVFEARLRAGLEGAVPGRIERVAPLGSTGGFKNRAEAEAARLGRLAEAGADFLLDIETTYGLFGYEGVLVVRLEGDLYRVADGKRLWRNALVASTGPVLADARLSDPAKSGLIP
ncbi:MAG TPA: hypothetical protein HPP83_06895, partial [Candidatus Hydrogenedentes bacterium]|nr:hypothetical protein [Candidatus Hydrogenedentota bacterium]